MNLLMKTIVYNTFFCIRFSLTATSPCFFTGDGDRDVDVEVDSDEDSELKAVEESDESSDEDNTSYSLFFLLNFLFLFTAGEGLRRLCFRLSS